MSKDESASKIYTRTGDKGQTSLIGGTRISKADPRLDAYGTVDELNSVIGCLRAEIQMRIQMSALTEVDAFLTVVQNELFNVGSQLACEDESLRPRLPRIHEDAISNFETKMDAYSSHLAPLKNFILPGGSRSASLAHLARTVCRRAERACVALSTGDAAGSEIVIRYLNRLSDYLFVLARYLNHLENISEPIWKS